MPAKGAIPEDEQRNLIHGYHAAVSYMDAQLGKVLDALDNTGLSKNTIIVLWGDHGWHLGDHGMWCKHTNYEQATRIPLIFVAPGVAKANTRTFSMVESVDVYPSLAELAGLPAPKNVEGTSVVPILKEPSAKTKEYILHVYPRGDGLGRAVRTSTHRLVEWRKVDAPSDTAVFELYDYKKDPEETKNLAAEQPKTVEQLREILKKQPEPKAQIQSGGNTKKGKKAKG